MNMKTRYMIKSQRKNSHNTDIIKSNDPVKHGSQNLLHGDFF